MTIISQADLDRRMGMTIDPNSVPRHDGADQGCMEEVIEAGSDARFKASGAGRRGTAVYDPKELGEEGYFGSKTVITVSDVPPLAAELDPKGAKPAKPAAPAIPRTPEELLAQMGLKKA